MIARDACAIAAVFASRFAAAASLLALLCATPARATTADPFQWLEDVEGARALEWVRDRNSSSLEQLTSDSRYQRYYEAALAIAEDKSRIPIGSLRDGWVYNLWQDGANVRGIWRRATLASYRTSSPDWQTLLDIDALARAENRNWVFKDASCIPPKGERCMLRLSDGGKDASVVREFDVRSRTFVADGFVLPEAKSDLVWEDADTLIVATDWGPGTLTASGYPFIVKRWSRATPLSSAREIHRGQPQDVRVKPLRFDGAGGHHLITIAEADTFFTTTYYALRSSSGRHSAGESPAESLGKPAGLVRMLLPRKVTLQSVHQHQLVFTIGEDWQQWKAGSLLSMSLVDIDSANPQPAVHSALVPGPRDSIEGAASTSAGLLVASYSNVRGRILRLRFDGGQWNSVRLPLPDNGSVRIATADPAAGTAFIGYENFLQPNSLYAVDVDAGRAEPVKSLSPKFDAAGYVAEQFEARSRDGTQVPYFIVRARQFEANGTAPTLLYAYGGFQISMLPTYSATVGKLWLEEGGVFVLANIRGGGEFGPAWHEAGLKTARQVVYDDFIAVAEDLIRRKITSPRRLGIQGGSNGGLLMGVMLTQRPELFNAVVAEVPLLDMLRYHRLLAGASWVDEYGSPDVPAERAWLEKLSPYQNLTRRTDFPTPFLVTSTKDDRVHPGHARKYAAKLESLGMPFLYYENIDGGHSAAANLRERARRSALEFTYLAQQLIGSGR